MARTSVQTKGKWFYGRRIRSGGASNKSKHKHKTWEEFPVGSAKGRARCDCHYVYPCSSKSSK